jgi:hypothetical protein
MFAKFKKAVEDAAQRLDAATSSSSQALVRAAESVPRRLRRASQPPAPTSVALNDERVRTSAAGDLILHYQVQWRAIHAATVAQSTERVRVDASLQRVVRECNRRAASLSFLQKAVNNVAHELPSTVDSLRVDVASLADRLASLAATIAAAEKEQSIRDAFARASEHAIEQFKNDPHVIPSRTATAVALGSAAADDEGVDIALDDQNALESFLGPDVVNDEPEQQSDQLVSNDDVEEKVSAAVAAAPADDEPADDDDGYFGDS